MGFEEPETVYSEDAWFDEPPWTSRIFGEVQKRVLKAGRYGRLGMIMTPINVPTIEWLRVEVEEVDGT